LRTLTDDGFVGPKGVPSRISARNCIGAYMRAIRATLRCLEGVKKLGTATGALPELS
jgi:hypothetical protein